VLVVVAAWECALVCSCGKWISWIVSWRRVITLLVSGSTYSTNINHQSDLQKEWHRSKTYLQKYCLSAAGHEKSVAFGCLIWSEEQHSGVCTSIAPEH